MVKYEPTNVYPHNCGTPIKKGIVQLCNLSNMDKYGDNFHSKLFIVREPGKVDYKKYG